MAEEGLGIQMVAGLDAQPMETGTKQATNSLLGIASSAKTAKFALAGLAAGGLFLATQEALKLQAQAAELRKLLGDDMAETMTQSILDMAGELPAARRELFAITEQAARLGVRGEENLTRFTKTVATLASATNVSAENAANSLAKIARVTQTPISEVRNLGAAINELSNNYGTSASEIIKATGKLAPTLSQLGVAAPRIMGIAAAMNEVNVSVRRGATRLRRVFQQTMNPKRFATIADAINLTEAEFRQMMATSEGAEEIFSRMINVFATGGEAAEQLRTELSSASRQGLGAIAQQGSRVQQAMDDASRAFRLGTSAIIEDMKKSQTAGTQWGMVWDNVASTAAEGGGAIAEGATSVAEFGNFAAMAGRVTAEYEADVRNAITTVEDLDERVSQGSDSLDDYRESAAGVTNSIGKMNTRLGQGDQFVSQGEAIGGVTQILQQQVAAWGDASRGGEEAMTILGEFERHVNRLGPETQTTFLRQMLPAINDTNIGAERLINAMAILAQRLQMTQREFPEWLTGAFTPEIENMFGTVTSGSDDAMDATDKLIQKLREEREEINKGRLARIKLTEAWKTAGPEERRQIGNLLQDISFGEIHNELQQTTTELASGGDQLLRYRDGWDLLTDQQQDSLREIRRVNKFLQRTRDIMEDAEGLDFGEAFRVGLMERQQEMEDKMSLDLIPDSVEDPEELDALRELESMRVSPPPEAIRKWKQLKNEYADSGDEVNDLQEELDELSLATAQSQLRLLERVVKDVSSAFTNAFEAMMDESKDFEDALEDLLKTLGADLLQRGLEIGLMNLLTNPEGGSALFGMIDLGSRATGGPVSPGRAYEVGERGRELFVPNVAGTIIPNKDLQGGSGGGGGGKAVTVQVNQNFNLSAIDERGMSEMLDKNRDRIGQAAVEAIERSEIATRKVNARRRR